MADKNPQHRRVVPLAYSLPLDGAGLDVDPQSQAACRQRLDSRGNCWIVACPRHDPVRYARSFARHATDSWLVTDKPVNP